ncbi:aminoglycoside N(3)-acetyltransferase [Streptomyces purpureus]|uniref:AAC(3) family N-acetyltransferase n=1 Tax=Streptomyces purpureus TaxID=1951 RepID=A0A918H6T6_9ACTN|nr:AAC(3) family N-acetyltransferase [Streptomyces purpureus]GGT41148.1 AAC(3) family N-acetyltransferase [Streptomyces purpureus]
MTGPRGPGTLARDLEEIGVRDGATLLVHAGLHGTGLAAVPLREALRAALGPEGTLVVPAFTAENSDTSPVYRARVAGLTLAQVTAVRAAMPAFDPHTTPCPRMGRLAESVRTAEGAVRSAHPQTSFAAVGRRARELLARHPLESHLGEDSPLGALYRADAQVLMINVGFGVCTAFHLAEYRTGTPRRRYRCVVPGPDGRARWIAFQGVNVDDSDFEAIGSAFPFDAVREGWLGGAHARLFSLRTAVDHAVDWMTEKRGTPYRTRQD